jgi:murein DD-endopeptidase MepM/ murein hydrolase activator NlpD
MRPTSQPHASRRTPYALLVLASLAAVLLYVATLRALAAPPAGDSSGDGARAAVQAALDWRDGPTWQAGAVERRGDWALVSAWGRADADPLTALAHWSGASWAVALPGDPDYRAWLHGLGPDVLAPADRDFLLAGVEPATAVFTQGYRLPWTAAIESAVTQGSNPSNGHLYQVDFDLDGWGVSGPIVTAKPGVIVYLKESSNRGCWSLYCWRQANMVVVQHGPGEYSWYVHLAYQSVPDHLTVGSVVSHGTVIGVEGQTGYATGVHLHYMVSNAVPPSWPDPSNPDLAPWPPSGSIVAQDWCEAEMGVVWPPDRLRSGNVAAPAGAATLYRDARCGGPAETFAADDRDLFDNPVITRTASALGLPAGWAVRLYPQVDFGGAFTQLALEAPDLGRLPIGADRALSLRLAQTCWLCPGFNDLYEPDDSYVNALPLAAPALGHTFWITTDVDWARFEAIGGSEYLLLTSRLGPRTDTVLALYGGISATEFITEVDDTPGGLASRIGWTAPQSGTYYLRVRPYSGDTTGIDTDYDLYAVRVISRVYLPMTGNGP